jgi:dTDP-4-amino-4,6-dideoxygalactose transaminase
VLVGVGFIGDKPAVLGYAPVFETFVPIVRPTLPAYTADMARRVASLLETGMLTKGPCLREFETGIARHLNVKHAVAVSSCTLGLMLAGHGLGLQGEVIVPSFTFMATVHPLVWLGIEPVFVEIDRETWNIDPAAIDAAITSRTSGIIAVHNFGNPAPIAELQALAQRRGLALIFDAAHGFGARYRGRPVGAFGDVEVFSLSPTKLLVAGEGGIVATNNDTLARHVTLGREYGNPGDYGSEFAGLNARMPEFNALLGIESLRMLEANVAARNRVADAFRSRLGRLPGLSFQKIHPDDTCSYKDFSMTVNTQEFGLSRDELAAGLKAERIDTRRYHFPPVHTHATYCQISASVRQAGLLVTEEVAARSLTLPMWSRMDSSTVDGICTAIERLHKHVGAVRDVLKRTTIPEADQKRVANPMEGA